MRNLLSVAWSILFVLTQQTVCMHETLKSNFLKKTLNKDTQYSLLESSPETFKAYSIENFHIHPELIKSDETNDKNQACLLGLKGSYNALSRIRAMKKNLEKRKKDILDIQNNNDLLKKEVSKSFCKYMFSIFFTAVLIGAGGHRIYTEEDIKPKLPGCILIACAFIPLKYAYGNFMDGITEDGKQKSLETKQNNLNTNKEFLENIEKSINHRISQLHGNTKSVHNNNNVLPRHHSHK